MSAIGNTTTTPPSSGTVQAGQTMSGSTDVTNPNATLDKDGFLKMFVAQMQNQDPSSSQDPNESTQEMATFSMVEQLTNLNTENQQIANQLQSSSAVGLIGHTVSYIDANGNSQTGAVQKVSMNTDGTSTLTVGDQPGVNPTSITDVA